MDNKMMGFPLTNDQMSQLVNGATSITLKPGILLSRLQIDKTYYVKESLFWKDGMFYHADKAPVEVPENHGMKGIRDFIGPVLMPKWAARYTITILSTDIRDNETTIGVRLERLAD